MKSHQLESDRAEKAGQGGSTDRLKVIGGWGGGKPSLMTAAWDAGRRYTWAEMNEGLEGPDDSPFFLRMKEGQVIAACLRIDHNPQAPDVVLAGAGEDRERSDPLVV